MTFHCEDDLIAMILFYFSGLLFRKVMKTCFLRAYLSIAEKRHFQKARKITKNRGSKIEELLPRKYRQSRWFSMVASHSTSITFFGIRNSWAIFKWQISQGRFFFFLVHCFNLAWWLCNIEMLRDYILYAKIVLYWFRF